MSEKFRLCIAGARQHRENQISINATSTIIISYQTYIDMPTLYDFIWTNN